MIHIYTGSGKGKTTAAFGLALRASGQNLKVVIYQFLKPKTLLSGEEVSARKIKGIKVVRFNQMHPMFKRGICALPGKSNKKLKETIGKDFKAVTRAMISGRYDMVVLDEIINVIDQNFIDRSNFLRMLKAVPQKIELVLTGRGDISDIEQYADYITVMADKKHPFKRGKKARRGVEY